MSRHVLKCPDGCDRRECRVKTYIHEDGSFHFDGVHLDLVRVDKTEWGDRVTTAVALSHEGGAEDVDWSTGELVHIEFASQDGEGPDAEHYATRLTPDEADQIAAALITRSDEARRRLAARVQDADDRAAELADALTDGKRQPVGQGGKATFATARAGAR